MKSKKIIVGNDFHFPYSDEAAVKTFMAAIKKDKPDIIVLNGDIMDCYAISRFIVDRRKPNFLNELTTVKDFLAKIRKAAPKAEIIFTEGNHELRLRNYIRSNAAELEGIEELELKNLLKLDELDIKWLDYMDPYYVTDDFVIVHGSIVRKSSGASAIGELLKHNRSGLSGHVHRGAVVYHTTDKERFWIENYCMCSLNPEYIAGKPDWQLGFTILTVVKGEVLFELVRIK